MKRKLKSEFYVHEVSPEVPFIEALTRPRTQGMFPSRKAAEDFIAKQPSRYRFLILEMTYGGGGKGPLFESR
jgi:hypothetical protein